MSKVSFGLYNQISHRNKQYQDHIKSITNFSFNLVVEVNNGNPEEVIEDSCITNILKEAANQNSEWVFIVAYGFVGFSPVIIKDLINYACINNYSAVGHILDLLQRPYDDKVYYSLHNQCMLINISDWIKSGSPGWGESTYVENFLLTSVQRSQDNHHDCYTPFWIKSNYEKITVTGELADGWKLVDGLLSAGMHIGSFPPDIKDIKMHLYPDHGTDFEKVLSGNDSVIPQEKKQREWLSNTNITNKKNDVYVFNTCSIDKEDIDIKKINNLYTVASGFKPLLLLNQCDWDDKTRIVYFDYSEKALNFKQWLLDNWDGKDYPAIVNYYSTHIDKEITFIWHFLSRDVVKEWNTTMEYFGGNDEWLNFWERYKTLSHSFLKINLFENCELMLKDMIDHQGSNLIWFSNVFYSIVSLRYFDPPSLDEIYQKFIKDLSTYSKELQLVGYDNKGKKVLKYVKGFENDFKTYH